MFSDSDANLGEMGNMILTNHRQTGYFKAAFPQIPVTCHSFWSWSFASVPFHHFPSECPYRSTSHWSPCMFFFTLSVMGSAHHRREAAPVFLKVFMILHLKFHEFVRGVKIGWCDHLLSPCSSRLPTPSEEFLAHLRCGAGSLSPVSSLACPRHRQLALYLLPEAIRNKVTWRRRNHGWGQVMVPF